MNLLKTQISLAFYVFTLKDLRQLQYMVIWAFLKILYFGSWPLIVLQNYNFLSAFNEILSLWNEFMEDKVGIYVH